jgi:CRP/FNR family cyclic AMP-dependent transcriptional regulator
MPTHASRTDVMAWTVIDPEQLGEINLFSQCGTADLGKIATLISVERYRRDDLIISEGSPGDRVFFVREGSVRVSKSIPGVGEEALAILSAGSYFGEMALFGEESQRSADVYADSSSTLFVVYVEEFRALLDADDSLATKVLWGAAQTLAERLRAANAKVMFLSAAGVFS